MLHYVGDCKVVDIVITYIHCVSKKTVEIVLGITLSNFHQL